MVLNISGTFQFHVCQSCYQSKNLLVEHQCRKSHPGQYPDGNKAYGAIACPYSITPFNNSHNSNVQPSPPQMPNDFSQERNTQPLASACVSSSLFNSSSQNCSHCKNVNCKCVTYYHKPSFLCDCHQCHDFFQELQIEINDCVIGNLDVHGEYVYIHDEPLKQITMCDECETEPLAPWSNVLCESCDRYFKNLEYPEEWRSSNGYYTDSDEEYGSYDW